MSKNNQVSKLVTDVVSLKANMSRAAFLELCDLVGEEEAGALVKAAREEAEASSKPAPVVTAADTPAAIVEPVQTEQVTATPATPPQVQSEQVTAKPAKPAQGMVLTKEEKSIINRIRAGEAFRFGAEPSVDARVFDFMTERHIALSFLAKLAKTGEEIVPSKIAAGVEKYAALISEEIADMGDEWEFATGAIGIAVPLARLVNGDVEDDAVQKMTDLLVETMEKCRDEYQAAMVLKYQKSVESDTSQETQARKPARRK